MPLSFLSETLGIAHTKLLPKPLLLAGKTALIHLRPLLSMIPHMGKGSFKYPIPLSTIGERMLRLLAML
ncbi:Uncharacterised protein [Chlamydia trachomatis]|nr:Uncharacterised protein [Chlamydia trachomatis]